jgi:protein required for attachment to host cells
MELDEWVVVASRTQVKIFKRSRTDRPLRWIYTLANKEALQKNRDIAEIPEFPPRPHIIIEKFARKIADTLRVGSEHHSFSRLHVFAEPHLLGQIKLHIPKCMKDVEVHWIAKDLEKATAEELTQRVV